MDRVQPGLTEAKMDELTSGLNICLPAEARVWWGWHDGVPAKSIDWARERELGGVAFEYVPLCEAVNNYLLVRKEVAGFSRSMPPPANDPEWHWRSEWFPLTQLGGIAIDCSVPFGSPTPVRLLDWHFEDFPQVKASSLGEVVKWWIEALDKGVWRYDETDGRWESDWDLLDDPVRRSSGLV
ncbi:MAG TPA: hypothetical protein VLJ42_10595 [Solirubrobacteraceae bacterium]|nr:hypothetical protein [Solirubrobacteraceae bacterium]